MIQPTPTKRFVLDPLRPCNIRCRMCYYLHSYRDWHKYYWTFEQCKERIDQGIARGNNYMDITGGEPTIYKHIEDVIKYALSKGVRSCIITNGIVSPEKSHSLLCAGLDGFLVSRHGLKDTHNYITNRGDSYDRQEEFLQGLKFSSVNPDLELRFNCVINKFNENDLLGVAKELAVHKPAIVNFINMNPHHEWRDESLAVQDVIADLRVVEPNLNAAIEYLESEGIGVNVRYYPMCRIAEKYRRTVCSDLHVMMDPAEWDYWMDTDKPKTLDTHIEWGENCSNDVEEKGHPCISCSIHNICGGANKHFHKASNDIYGEVLEAQSLDAVSADEANDFYHYRKHNVMTLEER